MLLLLLLLPLLPLLLPLLPLLLPLLPLLRRAALGLTESPNFYGPWPLVLNPKP